MNKFIKFLLCFLLTLSTIISIIDFNCFDYSFYKKEYHELKTAQQIGVSESDLDLMFYDLLDYLKGDKENLDLQVKVNGQLREVYNEREKIHMVDVKDLYDKAILVRNISLGLVIILVINLLISKDYKGIFNSYIDSLKIYGVICGIIALFCIFDFNTFWINFHKIFFTKNDYWLLDPRTDILINMVPEKFFFDLVTRIVIEVILALIIYFVIFKFLDKKVNKDDKYSAL